MTTQPRLVNKQFNSPIGLYSQQNVQEVLEREQQILANGAIGIDFHNPSVGKPANLQNSAVLRMLEEEENRRGGRASNGDYDYPRPLRDVSWPPPDYDNKNQVRSSFRDVIIPGSKRVAWPPPQEGILDPTEAAQQQNAAEPQGGTHYSNQSQGLQQNSYSIQQTASYQQSKQQSHRPLNPLEISSVGTGSPLASPALNQTPQGYRPVTPAGSKGWAPVHSPVATPTGPGSQKYFGAPEQGYSNQPQYQSVAQPYRDVNQAYPSAQSQGYQAPGQYPPAAQQFHPSGQQSQQHSAQQYPYQPGSQQYQSQPFGQSAPSQNQVPQPAVAHAQVAASRSQPVRKIEPPPSTITLRSSAPVSQKSPAVYSAQPATASFKGGKHLRGDLKWPPENVRQRMEEENKQLMELAKGPAVRPRRQEKDYSRFFAQHALNSTYPGYKIPPGTQYYRPE